MKHGCMCMYRWNESHLGFTVMMDMRDVDWSVSTALLTRLQVRNCPEYIVWAVQQETDCVGIELVLYADSPSSDSQELLFC